MRAPRIRAARRLDQLIGQVARRAVGKKAAALGGLAAHWPEIAGRDLALTAAPERISFPRGAREGGTVTLRVDPAHALAVSYDTARIIDRLNTHFGYPAIAKIKLVQGRQRPSAPRASPAPTVMSDSDRAELAQALESVTDPEIKTRLDSLGRSLYGRSARAKRDW